MNRYLALSLTALLAMPVLQARADDYTSSVHGQTLIQKNAEAYAGKSEKASRWETVEADNGSIYRVDLGHVEVVGRGVSTRIVKDEGDEVLPYSTVFDCGGHYYMSNLGWQYAPPRSVIGRIATLACASKMVANMSSPYTAASLPAFCMEDDITPAKIKECTCADDNMNSPCVVHMRSAHVRRHPERALMLECMGMKAYEDPQPSGHPASLTQCDADLRNQQRQFGLPDVGMSDEQKNSYYRTWGTKAVTISPPDDDQPTTNQWLSTGDYAIDVHSIKRSATSATATVKKDGKIATLIFDCRGHFQDAADLTHTQIAPPGSIASSVAATACATPNQTAQGRPN